jgi:hypothetical protein
LHCESLLFDHLIGGRQQRFRDGKAESCGGLAVDHQPELGRQHHREAGWLLAFEDATGVDDNGIDPGRRRLVQTCDLPHTMISNGLRC